MANTFKRFINGGNYYYFGDPPTHASGVILNKNSLILTEAGQTEQLVATVTPSDAIDKTVTWTSSNTSVAIVSRNGLVTCVEPGTCTITCTTNDGGLTATCSVKKIINFATQGPCPDGFHVPLNTDWLGVYNIWKGLGGTGTDPWGFINALKLPRAGIRGWDRASVSYVGTACYYRTSYNNNNESVILESNSTYIYPRNSSYVSSGCSIRAFKNEPVVPTSSWTKLYGTSIEAGGIFWSSDLGLISLSSNGTDWITIADKNLGATTVWNGGDSLTDANCGGYFQWGNNHMFPAANSSETITTSSTQVDVTGYGPGNYYENSTWIATVPRGSNWHGNLRGGIDGNVPVD